jgi:hypothetical protein
MKYKVKVIGHAPPFKWAVYCQPDDSKTWRMAQREDTFMKRASNNDGTHLVTERKNCEGTAPTFEDAMMEGREAAQAAEFDRKHAETVHEQEIDVFDVNEVLDSIPDAMPETWRNR